METANPAQPTQATNRANRRCLYFGLFSALSSACNFEGTQTMRIALNIVAGLLVLTGVIWFLQGINVLPGSFMTGQIQWAVYGGIAVAAGIGLFLGANRAAKSS
jgi:hypothetical protein